MPFGSISESIEVLRKHARLRRLFQEDTGVKSCFWFAKDPDSRFHVFSGVFRVVMAIVFAPIYIVYPRNCVGSVKEYLKQLAWFVEYSNTPHAILHTSPMGGPAEYSPTGLFPRWVLRVDFDDEGGFDFEQIPWSEKPVGTTYNAISYAMSCARVLFDEAGEELLDPHPEGGRMYSLRDRKRISRMVLQEYVLAKRKASSGLTGRRTEYIWLDEFCLSSDNTTLPQQEEEERRNEVGLLADIFTNAENVCVFCDVVNCEHVGLECSWNKRLFTLAEILHARNVLILTRRKESGEERLVTRITFSHGDQFRRRIQTEAALASRWHLYAVMQHSTNAGAASWQTVIHSLVVEAICRDEADNFQDHQFLGKGLNGLLPRRARLGDLGGKDGWQDLAWLLELNQGFYNAASLAAVCSLAEFNVPTYRWWGKPIAPSEGNERLEPLVTAFPVRFVMPDDSLQPTLCVVHPKTIPIKSSLRRDGAALYNNDELRGIKNLAITTLFILSLIFGGVLFGTLNYGGGIAIIYCASILYAILDLVASTVYVVREGWVYLDTRTWIDGAEKLKKLDPNLADITRWGDKQLCPKWDSPREMIHEDRKGTHNRWSAFLVDIQSKVVVPVTVIDHPNNLVVLALHGCGVTCMLLNREGKGNTVASKVGMANLPTYVLAQAVEAGTVYVGGGPPSADREKGNDS